MNTATALWGIQTAILVYFFVINTIYFVFTAIAFFDLLAFDRRSRRRGFGDVLSGTTFRPISIIVPAYNEKETIVSSVHSVLELGYPEFELIVVNDGSDDETLDLLHQSFTLFPVADTTRAQLKTKPVRAIYRSLDHPNLVVVDKERGGKSDALNAGMNISQFPLFCSVDADSLINADALLRIARPFVEDERIIAAGGVVRVLNGAVIENHRVRASRAPKKLIHLCQSIEYVRGFLTGRTALARMNALMIVSGAFGLFLKKAVMDAGGYRSDTVCEDMELIVRLQRVAREKKSGGKVIFVPDPVLWTQVPSDYPSLLRQRDRWQRGLIESLLMHIRMLFNPRYGAVGMIAMPFYLFIEALGPMIELFGYALIPAMWLFGKFDVRFALLFFAMAVLYNIMLSLLALIVDDLLFQRYERAGDLVKMMLSAFLEFIGYRQILALRRTMASLTFLFRRGQWGRIRREKMGTEKAAAAA